MSFACTLPKSKFHQPSQCLYEKLGFQPEINSMRDNEKFRRKQGERAGIHQLIVDHKKQRRAKNWKNAPPKRDNQETESADSAKPAFERLDTGNRDAGRIHHENAKKKPAGEDKKLPEKSQLESGDNLENCPEIAWIGESQLPSNFSGLAKNHALLCVNCNSCLPCRKRSYGHFLFPWRPNRSTDVN